MKRTLKVLTLIAIGILCIGIVSVIFIYGFGKWYLSTENKNFERGRQAWDESQRNLNCDLLPIHCLVRDKNFESIQQVIDKGFAKDQQDVWGNNALFIVWKWAPKEKNRHSIELLLKAQVSPNICDKNGDCPLWQTMRSHDYEMARMLLEYGANPNIKVGYTSDKKLTLLSEMVIQKDVSAAEFLVKHGASLDLPDDYGYTACSRAKLYQTESMFSFCRR